MTPRERIKTSLNHQEPDRIPIGYFATPEANIKLKKYLSVDNDDNLLKRLGCDYRRIFPEYIGPKNLVGVTGIDMPGKDCWGTVRKKVKNRKDFESLVLDSKDNVKNTVSYIKEYRETIIRRNSKIGVGIIYYNLQN